MNTVFRNLVQFTVLWAVHFAMFLAIVAAHDGWEHAWKLHGLIADWTSLLAGFVDGMITLLISTGVVADRSTRHEQRK